MSGTAAARAMGEVTSQSRLLVRVAGRGLLITQTAIATTMAAQAAEASALKESPKKSSTDGCGRPRRARVLELVEELRHPRRKGGAACQSVEQRRFQVRPGPPPEGCSRSHDNGRREQVQAVVLEVQHGRHEGGGGYPVATPGPLVSQHEAGDCEDGRKHQPRVHPCLGAVVVQVGARCHKGSGTSCLPCGRRACHPTTRRPVLRAGPRSSTGHGLPGRTCRTAVPSSAT